MSQYRRSYVPGGVYFLTLVTYQQIPLFSDVENISLLRQAIAKMRTEKPFDNIRKLSAFAHRTRSAIALKSTTFKCDRLIFKTVATRAIALW
jgi:hypothetical protein